MKTFDKTTATHLLVVRNLGIRKEIIIVPAKRASYIVSQAVYQHQLGTKYSKIQVYELTWDAAKEAKKLFNNITVSYPGELNENMYNSNSKEVKFLNDTIIPNNLELDLDSVLNADDAKRKDFYLVIFSCPSNPESSVTIYKSTVKHDAVALAENTPMVDELFDSRNFKPAFKQLFAMFANKEYCDIPASTYEKFTKTVRPLIEICPVAEN